MDVEGLVVHVIHDRARWRLGMWRALVASAKSRNLRSGLIQVVAAIIDRLAGEGVLGRDDAFGVSREFTGSMEIGRGRGRRRRGSEEGDEEDKGEPLSQLVEKLDATVFGLIEALDADSADLPRLLDEALQGSLWARQINREDSEIGSGIWQSSKRVRNSSGSTRRPPRGKAILRWESVLMLVWNLMD